MVPFGGSVSQRIMATKTGPSMAIPLVDLVAQYRDLKKEIDSAVARVFEGGQFILGTEVASFEMEFAATIGVRHAVGVNSGTSALTLALRAAGIGLGDEVITVPFTFVATVAAIDAVGARTRFVDIDPESFTMDPKNIEPEVTKRTKAIVPVHLFGHPVDMAPVLAIADKYGLHVIEDACQAHGALYSDQPVGGLGDIGCFSFYPTKNLGAFGEGGIVVTNDVKLASTVRSLRDWGQERSQVYVRKGGNHRLDALQAAILRVKLPHLQDWTDARRRIARSYDTYFENTELRTPTEMGNARHVYHVYAIRSAIRDSLVATLQAERIGAAIQYPRPIHLQPAYADLGYGPGDFPVAEAASRELLSLPIYPELPRSGLERVATVIQQVIEGNRNTPTTHV